MLLPPFTALSVVVCELRAPRAMLETGLPEIVTACAWDVGQTIELLTERVSSAEKEAALILHLSPQLAASQNEVWCLACRLACFCPDTRVSVLIHGQDVFEEKAAQSAGALRRPA